MRETHLAAGRCAGALALSLGLLAPGAAAQTAGAGGGGDLRRHAEGLQGHLRAPLRVAVARPGRQHAQARPARASASAAKVVFNGSYGRGDDLTVSVRPRSRHARSSVRVPVGAVTRAGHGRDRPRRAQSEADRAGRDPAPAAARPQPGAQPGARAARRRRCGVETGTSRTRAYVGRAPRGHLLLPGHRRARHAARPSTWSARATARRSRPGPRRRRRRARSRASPGTAGIGRSSPPSRAATRSA